MCTLDDSISLVALQFTFSNQDILPTAVQQLADETEVEQCQRIRHSGSGRELIKPTDDCSLVEFVGELEAAGYQLVSAFSQQRLQPRDQRRNYYIVRFMFARSDLVKRNEGFAMIKGEIRSNLLQLCHQALWQVRVFNNPLYEEGQEVLGQHSLMINLGKRLPLYRAGGERVAEWRKDAKGRRLGVAPVLLTARHQLRVGAGSVVLA